MSKKTERPQNKNLNPPLKKGCDPLPGAGRPKGVKNWSVVFKCLFTMTPEEIKKSTGIELPKTYEKKDLQFLVGLQAIKKALSGDLNALDRIMDRMDGKAKQFIEVEDSSNDEEADNIRAYNNMPNELKKQFHEEEIKKLKKEKK